MPYTDVWSDAIPADSAAANTVGAQLRQLRLDIHERINTLIGQSTLNTPLADPLMPVYAPNLFIPVWEMKSQDGSGNTIPVNLGDGGITVTHASQVNGTFWFPIKLAPGCVLGNITAYSIVYVGTLTMMVTAYHLPFSTSTIGGSVALGNIGTQATGSLGTGFRTVTSTGQSGTALVAGDEYFGSVVVTPSSGGSDESSFFGVLLNYTRPVANLVV